VAPKIAAAGSTDLDSLEAKVAEAQELDTSIKTKDTEINILRVEISHLAGAAEALRQASDRAQKCRAALGGVALETVVDELDALGVDPIAGLRRLRLDLATKLETARASSAEVEREHTIALERIANFARPQTRLSPKEMLLLHPFQRD
jgi:predicted RNase H-like nuclease (RuvC/YqgF family)